MANENRLYAKLTLDFADSHKIAPLSDAAFRAYIRMLLWSRRMLTDGKIPGPMAKVFAKPNVLRELTVNDPLSPSLIIDGDDFWLHDFTEHQSSRAEVEAMTERNRSNGRRGGLAKSKQVASKSLSETEAKTYPETQTETETKTSTTDVVERPAKRGSRLSPDWMPSAASIAKAQEDAPNVDHKAEHATFVDYWIAQPGQKGVKTDWEATWRNWMRRKQGDTRTTSARRPVAKADQNAALYHELYGGGNERTGSFRAIDSGLST